MNAIIVDDEPIMVRSFLRLVKNIEKITCIKAFSNAKDVLDFSRIQKFDVAFIDIEMPNMKGVELAERLQIENPDVLIIFVSAWDEDEKIDDKSICKGYINKPFSEDDIRRELEYALQTFCKS